MVVKGLRAERVNVDFTVSLHDVSILLLGCMGSFHVPTTNQNGAYVICAARAKGGLWGASSVSSGAWQMAMQHQGLGAAPEVEKVGLHNWSSRVGPGAGAGCQVVAGM
jgi:hypothetical protein